MLKNVKENNSRRRWKERTVRSNFVLRIKEWNKNIRGWGMWGERKEMSELHAYREKKMKYKKHPSVVCQPFSSLNNILTQKIDDVTSFEVGRRRPIEFGNDAQRKKYP